MKKFKDLIIENQEINNDYNLILVPEIPYLFYSSPGRLVFIASIKEEEKKTLPSRIGDGSFLFFYANNEGELIDDQYGWMLTGSYEKGFDYVDTSSFKNKSIIYKILTLFIHRHLPKNVYEDFIEEDNNGIILIEVKDLLDYIKKQYWVSDTIKYENINDFNERLTKFIINKFKLNVKSSVNKFNLSITL